MVDRDRIRPIGLQLDRITAAFGGDINQLQRAIERSEMVSRQFSDDEGRMAGAHRSITDQDRAGWIHDMALTLN